jgi:hypothetical protein
VFVRVRVRFLEKRGDKDKKGQKAKNKGGQKWVKARETGKRCL